MAVHFIFAVLSVSSYCASATQVVVDSLGKMRFGYTLTIVGLLGLTQALPEASLQRSVDPAINQALGHSKTVPLNNTAFTCKVLDIALGGGNASVAEATDSTYSALEDVN